jgi:O-antigen/teichoic acid export membrane protein
MMAQMRQRLPWLFGLVASEGLSGWLVRAAAGNSVVRFLGILASFAFGVQLARGLGVSGFGYYSIAIAVISLATLPSEFGLPTFVTREVAAASVRNDLDEVLDVVRWAIRSCLWLSLAVMATVVAGTLLLSGFYSRSLTECLLIGAPIIPLAALSRVRCGALQGLHRVVQAQVPENLLRPALLSAALAAVYLLGVRLTPQFAIALYAATSAIVFALSWFWLRLALPRGPGERKPETARSITSSLPMGLMDGIRVIQGETSIFVAALVVVPGVVGLLRIANITATIAATPLAVLAQTGSPLMAKLHETGERARLQRAVTALAHAQFAGILIMSLPLLLFPAQLLTFAFGHAFAVASGALRVLLIGQLFNAAFGPNIWLLNMAHHERRVLRALVIALAINIVAVPLLASRWGATGGAFALLASMVCWNVISWRDARRLLGIETSILRWPWRLETRSAH